VNNYISLISLEKYILLYYRCLPGTNCTIKHAILIIIILILWFNLYSNSTITTSS